jgi:hypothetical protein
MMRARRNRIDANQAAIVQAVRGIGAVWIATTGDPRIGFDGLVGFRETLYPVEIKDGAKSPCERKLTPGEQQRVAELAAVGVHVCVATCPHDVLVAIGAIYEQSAI